jgi:autophagy-related protein 11
VEAQYDDHRHAYEAEIDRLRVQLQDLTDRSSQDQAKIENLMQENATLGADIVDERDAHSSAVHEQERLHAEIASLRQQLDESRSETRKKAREVDQLQAELTQVAADYQEVKNLEENHALRVETLLKDQQDTLQNLEEARCRGENLETQIHAALTEGNEARRELQDVRSEKDRLLRMQASEHDRRLRDQIAEADGDRAVLEKQFFQLKSELEFLRREHDAAQSELQTARDELGRKAHALTDVSRGEEHLKGEVGTLRASQADLETKYERSQRLVLEILQVAISLRQFLVRAMVSAQNASSYPKTQPLSDSIFSAGQGGGRAPLPSGTPVEEAPSIDPTDPEMALEVLREFDLDICAEALAKPVNVLKKWQRQCKEYRERAKGRITFRNFAKGDLALFLPIKNSQQKPWAAFNSAY